MSALLDDENLSDSIRTMERLFPKANFNSEVCFGLISPEIIEIHYLAQLVMFRGVKMYDETKQAVSDFDYGRGAFQKVSWSVRAPIVEDVEPMAKKLLVRPEERVAHVEQKIDSLADKMAELTLLVCKKGPSQEEKEGIFTYRRKTGHAANRCPDCLHRATRCTSYQKMRHDYKGGDGVPAEEKTSGESHLTVVMESTIDENEVVVEEVLAVKRGADGQSIPKHPRPEGHLTVEDLLKPVRYPLRSEKKRSAKAKMKDTSKKT